MMMKGKTGLVLLCCFIQVIVHGQDTIFKRNGEVISAKVLEINIKEISYRRADLPDSPLMIVSKNDILRIKYTTGQIDSFKVVPQQVQVLVNRVPVTVYSHPESISRATRNGVFVYQGHHISDSRLFGIANGRNLIWNNREIDLNIVESKRNKLLQYSIGYGGAIVGIGCLYASILAISTNGPSDNVFISMLTANIGTAAFVSSQIVSLSYKMKRVKHANKVMELYNQSLK